jgi:hypothetical protein
MKEDSAQHDGPMKTVRVFRHRSTLPEALLCLSLLVSSRDCCRCCCCCCYHCYHCYHCCCGGGGPDACWLPADWATYHPSTRSAAVAAAAAEPFLTSRRNARRPLAETDAPKAWGEGARLYLCPRLLHKIRPPHGPLVSSRLVSEKLRVSLARRLAVPVQQRAAVSHSA